MGYCIDDICHNAGPICGAGSPYHCRADGGPPADHYCDDPGCETCMPWDDDDYPGEPIQPGDEHYRVAALDGSLSPASQAVVDGLLEGQEETP